MARKKIKSQELSIKSPEEKEKNSMIEEQNSEKDPPAQAENDIFNSEGELVVDVFETNSDFVVLTAIAGVKIQDLDISVEKDLMVIKGNRKDPHDNPEKKYFFQECYWGPFSRKIVLPENIDAEAANAQMDKGVLTVKIPKIDSKKQKSSSFTKVSADKEVKTS